MAEKNQLLENWINDNIVEDEESCNTIAEMANKDALAKLNVDISPDTCLALYGIVYDEIIKKLASKREDKTEFIINIADVVKIGYDNTVADEDSETQGNFNITMEEVGKKPVFTEDPDLYSAERGTQWMHKNVKEQRNIIEGIATASLKELQEQVDVVLAKPELVFPLWCIIHTSMTDYVKVARTEQNSSDFFINFVSRYTVHCQLLADNDVVITYQPSIGGKTDIKSNLIATSTTE